MKTALVLLALTGSVWAGNVVPDYGDVRLTGPFGERMDAMIRNHVERTDRSLSSSRPFPWLTSLGLRRRFADAAIGRFRFQCGAEFARRDADVLAEGRCEDCGGIETAGNGQVEH